MIRHLVRNHCRSFQIGKAPYRLWCTFKGEGVRDGTHTPAMKQYFKMKESVPGYLLLFQMGDFFEIFYEDAINASRLLDITLTVRDKTNNIPMCGIPLHTLETYIGKLIQKGQMVAVCEQITKEKEEEKYSAPPASRRRLRRDEASTKGKFLTSDGLVVREITRLVSPGTLIEDHLLTPRSNNFLVSVYFTHNAMNNSNVIALAWIDVSTGDFLFSTVQSVRDLRAELYRLQPAEILCPYQIKASVILNSTTSISDAVEAANGDKILIDLLRNPSPNVTKDFTSKQIAECLSAYRVTPRPETDFHQDIAVDCLKDIYDIASHTELPTSFSNEELAASGALFQYITQTQKGSLPSLSTPRKHFSSLSMFIDSSSYHSLELLSTTAGERTRTLLDTIDRTVTSSGARHLTSQLVSPLLDSVQINQRLDAVEMFYNNDYTRAEVRRYLKGCFDTERALQRISLKKCGPRDLSSIQHTISQLLPIYKIVKNTLDNFPCKNPGNWQILQQKVEHIRKTAESLQGLAKLLSNAIVESPPISLHFGSFVREGFNKELDEANNLQKESQKIVADLQSKYRSLLSLSSLKIKTNLTLGMHIELSNEFHNAVLKYNMKIQGKLNENKEGQTNSEPNHRQVLMHCQTMPSSMRYKTEEISMLDQRIQRAEFEIKSHEERIFRELVEACVANSASIREMANLVAWVDVSSALGEVSKIQSYCRPEIDDSGVFEIVDGRHPVVEHIQQSKQHITTFTPNTIKMDNQKNMFLLTGPNMGGKSTFLRQTAIHCILAQCGCFVPAASARIGVVDKIFSRVGAADDVKNDQSTFMMEMQEASNILHSATSRSLVIVDELGRGTSTMEGLSIAWAVLEYLHHHNQCRTIFATHYHELAQLTDTLPKLDCYQMMINENLTSKTVTFLHKVIRGVASKSYGVHVAQLAGLPSSVTERAESLVGKFQATSSSSLVESFPTSPTLKEFTEGVKFGEDDDALIIRVDKKKGSFVDCYDFLCKYYLKE